MSTHPRVVLNTLALIIDDLLSDPSCATKQFVDSAGWIDVSALAQLSSETMGADVQPLHISQVVRHQQVAKFDIRRGRLRRLKKPHPVQAHLPEVLYHGTTRSKMETYEPNGGIHPSKGRRLYLSANEADAWAIAHRFREGQPRVMYVDTRRATYQGVRFFPGRRPTLFQSTPIPYGCILNRRKDFAHQFSAGGLPLRMSAEGKPQVALIEVTRKSGTTWEIAKGKLEYGEAPAHTAVREVKEEMGLEQNLFPLFTFSPIRFPFFTPDRKLRLKTIYLFLLGLSDAHPVQFQPANAEDIHDVAWFDAEIAIDAITHRSLFPLMLQLRQMVQNNTLPINGS